MKKSFVDSNKTVSPFRSPEQESHNRSFQFNKAKYTEVTIQTFDKDVPFIAIYKPDINSDRKRTQATTKIVASLLNFEKMRVFYSLNKLFSLGPKEKSLRIKVQYLSCLFQRISNIRKQRVLKSLFLNKLKKNGNLTAAKNIGKIQNSILTKNLKAGLSQLRRNRLLQIVKQLSDGNQLADELKRTREELAKKKQESFSEFFIQKSKKLQKITNKETYLELMTQQDYKSGLKAQIKRFEQIRYSGFPKRKELVQNETVITVMSNVIQSYEASLKNYQSYCQQLQTQLAGFKDAEGIQQLKQTINQKDNTIRDIEAFVNEIGRMDVQLKKFTVQNKFMADRVLSTLVAHDKKLEQKGKSLQGINSKILASRSYLTSVIPTIMKKFEASQKQLKELQQQNNEFQTSKISETANFEREINDLKTQLEQQKARLLAFFQKRQNKNGLLDLKRKWKVNDELKSLVDYVANMHQRLQRLQNEKSEVQRQMQRQRVEIKKKSEKQIAELTKNIEKQKAKASKEENKLAQISKKIETQQSQVSKVERELQNKSKSLEKQKIDLTRKLQKEQSDISRVQKQLQTKTRQLENERHENQKKEEQLHESITKLSQFLRRNLQEAKHEGVLLQSEIGNNIADTLGPIVTPVEQLVDLVNKLKNKKKTEDQRLPHSPSKQSEKLSFVQSEVKLYRPEVNIDEFQKQIAHRLFSHLQSQLQAKQSEITKSKLHGDKLKQQQASISLVSDMKYKIEILEKQLQAQNNSNQLLSKAIAKIADLENTIKLLQKAILGLKNQNQEYSLKLEELKTYYQEQITIMKNQFSETVNLISSQYNDKLGGFTSQQSSNTKLISQKNEQILSKQLQIQQEIYNLRSHILSNITGSSTQSYQAPKSNEDGNGLKMKLSELQSQLNRKHNQYQRTQNRLKQTEQSLLVERQKVSSLQADLIKFQQQLGRNHKENDKLALQTHEQVKKVKIVLHALEQELQKKTKLAQSTQSKSNNLQKTIIRLEADYFNAQQQLQEAIRQCNVLEQRNMELNSELTHLKTQFFSIQIEVENSRNSKIYANNQISSLQSEIKERQSAINSILQQSKANSTSLNTQLFQSREQLILQERKFDQQLSVKSALINRLQRQLMQHQNTIRNLQQKCIIMQQNGKRAQHETKSQSNYDIKDREIELLKQQIASLQQFLADISHQYKQLQIKYHQQKLKFGGTPTEKLHNHQLEHSMEVIDKAINQLSDNAPFSEQVRSLIYNNQRLQISIEELQQERYKLLEKAKSLPERQYVVELVFNVLLGARGTSPQSAGGNAIWNELVRINEKCGEVGELFTQLQRFSLGQLTKKP